MTVTPLPVGGSLLAPAPSVKLRPHAIARPALSSHVRPALVLAERESRALMDAARAQDVTRGGRFLSNPAGISLWSSAWPTADGPGDAVQLGSVDWSYDTPVKHYVTIYRAMVTEEGTAHGETTLSVLQAVLALSGIPVDGNRLTMPAPPPRDPFRGAPPV